MVHIFIDEHDFKFMQFVDQGNQFTELNLSELFEEKETVLRKEGIDEEELLVLKSEITQDEGLEGYIYTFHIYSPIYLVNYAPWPLEYRIGQEIML